MLGYAVGPTDSEYKPASGLSESGNEPSGLVKASNFLTS
jgi:hypothetical protein